MGFAYVRHKGHEEAGVIYLMIEGADGYSLYVETQTLAGDLGWRCAMEKRSLAEVEARLSKEKSFDRDLWVIELEGGVRLSDLPGVEV